MKIVVLVKHVPEPTAALALRGRPHARPCQRRGATLRARRVRVEQAVRLVESGLSATLTFLTMGPARAARRTAQGARHGRRRRRPRPATRRSTAPTRWPRRSCWPGRSSASASTSCCTGMASTDAEMSVVPGDGRRPPRRPPAHVRRRACPSSTASVTIRRDTDTARRGGRRLPAGARVGHRPDRRGPLPVLQVDHGRQEEAGRRPGRWPTSASTPSRSAWRPPRPPSGRWRPSPRGRPAPSSPTTATAPARIADFLVAQKLL